MELAIKLHKYLTNGSSSYEVLNFFNRIKDKDTLALINEYFMEHFNKTPNEFISEKYELDEVYAISGTLNYIREPSSKNKKSRIKFYEKIGYFFSAEEE
jgi:hypothetical protein